MSFVEVEFAFFLPVVLALYWVMPRIRVLQNGVLLLAGWVFYASWNWKLLALLVGGSLIDYGLGRFLGRGVSADDATQGSRRRLALGLSLCVNLGALAYFKYEGFFAQSFNDLMGAFGLSASLPVLQIILPLGISFYTLQRVGYIVDVYYRRLPASRSLLDFLLFTGFFPQLTAGPIARGAELLPQLEKPRRLTAMLLASGAATVLLGYMLKAWVADSIGPQLVDPVFAASAQYTSGAHWLALFGYTLQIFGDFAGYSLIAIGIARLFGVELPINFDYPFLSKSLPEFWRRWHITLNRWLFDYIYSPLVSGSGWFRGRFYSALMLVFLASGLWHGAAFTFVFWGVMHGIGMMVHRAWDEYYRSLCRKDRRYVAWRKTLGYSLAAWFVTQSYFVLSLIPFRAADFGQTFAFAGRLLSSGGTQWAQVGTVPTLNLLLAAGFVLLYHLVELPGLRRLRELFFAVPAPLRGAAYGLVVIYLLLFVPVGASTFIYRQF